MSSDSILKYLTPNMRRLHDNALLLSSQYRGYDNVPLSRYEIAENDYKDQDKTLIEVVEGISIYLDFPGDISNLSSNTPFIENDLPITVLFPWKHDCEDLKVDIGDTFKIILVTEFNTEKELEFVIVDRLSAFEEFHLYREFIVAPKRVDGVDLTDLDEDDVVDDANDQGAKDFSDIYSEYD
jgi:hypothetical protein